MTREEAWVLRRPRERTHLLPVAAPESSVRPEVSPAVGTGPGRNETPCADDPAAEVLILDSRVGLTPAQFVNRKLIALLHWLPLASGPRGREVGER
jgi:hypothetical protein